MTDYPKSALVILNVPDIIRLTFISSNDQISAVWTAARYSSASPAVINSLPETSLISLGLHVSTSLNATAVVTGMEPWAQDAVYNDYW